MEAGGSTAEARGPAEDSVEIDSEEERSGFGDET